MASPDGISGVSEYKSPVRVWVWLVFWANAVIATVFSILCALVYQGLLNVLDSLNSGGQVPAGLPLSDWQSLFWGAAVSAIFAFLVTVMFHVSTLLLLLCSFKSLGHPGRRFGRAFVIAAALWTGLHVLNITLQFQSFAPVTKTLNELGTTPTFNTSMLRGCTALGYLSSVLYLLFSLLVFVWKEHPELLQVNLPGSSSATII